MSAVHVRFTAIIDGLIKHVRASVCVRVCGVCGCVRACVRACVSVCVYMCHKVRMSPCSYADSPKTRGALGSG